MLLQEELALWQIVTQRHLLLKTRPKIVPLWSTADRYTAGQRRSVTRAPPSDQRHTILAVIGRRQVMFTVIFVLINIKALHWGILVSQS
uniref:Uncharacterized protein n=1 Tax=Pyxicephalus adspersus TaxID=30357 RepID=A0AAV3A294_PYXAD|nr:TPA: hypothetical protein GDO54_014946 [Pyxicephalus adspersus]